MMAMLKRIIEVEDMMEKSINAYALTSSKFP